MSLITGLRHPFLNGICKKRNFLTPMASESMNQIFTLPAKQEVDEELEIIDQRKLPADYDHANFDPSEHRSPPTDRVFRLVDEISVLTLVEVAELSSILMKKIDMNKQPDVRVMKPRATGWDHIAMKAPTAAKEEKKPEKTV